MAGERSRPDAGSAGAAGGLPENALPAIRPPVHFRYDAFVSYTHGDDSHVAPMIQAAVEGLGGSWFKGRRRRLFRDQASLSASPHLWGSVVSELGASRWLLLLACPAAARSAWVNREVDWWLDNRSVENVLIAVTAGDLRWDETTLSFAHCEEAVLPARLATALRREPRWVDLRWMRLESRIDRDDPRLQDAAADIAAAISGVDKDTLIGEHISRRLRALRIARSVAAVLAVLLVISVVAAVIAVRETNAARQQLRIATARQVTSQAEAAAPRDPLGALRLLVAAQSIHPEARSRGDLLQVLTSSGVVGSMSVGSSPSHSLAVTPNGQTLATIDSRLRLWSLRQPAAPRLVASAPIGPEPLYAALAFTADGTQLLCACGRLLRWDVRTPAHPRSLPPGPEDGSYTLAVSPSGELAAIGFVSETSEFRLYRLNGHHAPQLLTTRTRSFDFASIEFSPDGQQLATASADGQVAVYAIDRKGRLHPSGSRLVVAQNRPIASVKFLHGGRSLIVAEGDGAISIYDRSDSKGWVRTARLPTEHSYIRDMEIVQNRGWIGLLFDDGTVQQYDIRYSRHPFRIDPAWQTGSSATGDLAVAAVSGRFLATVADDGTVQLNDLKSLIPSTQFAAKADRSQPLYESSPPNVAVAVAPSAPWITTVTYPHRLTVFSQAPDGRLRPQRTTGGPPEASDGITVHATQSPNGQLLYAAGRLYHWLSDENRAGPAWKSDPRVPPDDEMIPGSFSQDSRVLARGNELWDLSRSVSKPAHTGPWTSGLFAPRGRLLLATTTSDDGRRTLTLWDVTDATRPTRRGNPIAQLPSSLGDDPTFSPDGSKLAITQDAFTVAVFDIQQNDARAKLTQQLAEHEDEPVGVAFSPDGTVLASLDLSGTLILHDVTSNRGIVQLHPPISVDSATTMAFTHDGNWLVLGRQWGDVATLDLRPLLALRRDPVKAACLRSGRDLTATEWKAQGIEVDYERTCPE